jgi:hypothetical protein
LSALNFSPVRFDRIAATLTEHPSGAFETARARNHYETITNV